jgi:hypothetical protein
MQSSCILIFLRRVIQLLLTANVVPSSLILYIGTAEEIVPPKRLSLQEPHSVISHKTAFNIVAAEKTSNLTQH